MEVMDLSDNVTVPNEVTQQSNETGTCYIEDDRGQTLLLVSERADVFVQEPSDMWHPVIFSLENGTNIGSLTFLATEFQRGLDMLLRNGSLKMLVHNDADTGSQLKGTISMKPRLKTCCTATSIAAQHYG